MTTFTVAPPRARTPHVRSLSRAIADLASSETPESESMSNSVSIDVARRATVAALEDIRTEASTEGWDGYGALPVYSTTVTLALSLLQLLPSSLPAPDVSASPLGEISLHWSAGPRKVVSIAISPTGRLSFAALAGDSRLFGSEMMTDELPRSITVALQKVLGS